jgi:hypothetical protein
MTIDYTIQSRRRLAPSDLAGLPESELLISAYNESDRVGQVFADVPARAKHWLVHPEYGFSTPPSPSAIGGDVFLSTARNEAQFLRE